MLEGLDKVDWSNINHSHDKATKIPNWIRDLASDEKKVRSRAMSNLYEYLNHQGTLYEASAYAVPFFLELLQNNEVKVKGAILHLINSLASFGAYPSLKEDRIFYRFKPDKKDLSLYSEWHREFEWSKWEKELAMAEACQQEASKGVEIYLELLKRKNFRIKREVILLLSNFREHAPEILPTLSKILSKGKNSEILICTLASFGVLASPDPAYYKLIENSYLSNDNEVAKLAASIAFVRIFGDAAPQEALQTILNELDGLEKGFSTPIQKLYTIYTGSTTKVIGEVWEVFQYLGPRQEKYVVPILIEKTQTLQSYHSLGLLETLVHLTFNEETSTEFPNTHLTNLQKSILQIIYENKGVWGWGSLIFKDVLFSHGIPNKREKLKEYLDMNEVKKK